jgi:hypothetical protein
MVLFSLRSCFGIPVGSYHTDFPLSNHPIDSLPDACCQSLEKVAIDLLERAKQWTIGIHRYPERRIKEKQAGGSLAIGDAHGI